MKVPDHRLPLTKAINKYTFLLQLFKFVHAQVLGISENKTSGVFFILLLDFNLFLGDRGENFRELIDKEIMQSYF